MRGMSWMDFFTTHDSSGSFKHGQPTTSQVSPGYFSTVGMRMIRGRDFTSVAPGGAAPAEVVVNDAFAKRVWPREDALGQCIHLKKADAPCSVVVGVVENARMNKVLEAETALQFYIPFGSPGAVEYGGLVVVRTNGATALAANELRNGLRAAFPAGEPSVRTMSESLEPEYRPWQLGAKLFTSFGVLALVVALVGIYSTVSYSVAQRTHEFGVRIALGAQLGDLVRHVIGEGVRTVLVGVGVGVLLVIASGRLIASLLYGVDASDASTMVTVALTLLAAAALAAVVPAWRAARVNPLTALRAE